MIACGNHRTAPIFEEDGSEQSISFAVLAERSDQVAVWLEQCKVRKVEMRAESARLFGPNAPDSVEDT